MNEQARTALFIGKERTDSLQLSQSRQKGQITLKRDLLKHLGVGPDEKIEAHKLPDDRIVVKRLRPMARFLISSAACRTREGRR
jgi:hypothetical protein